MVLGRVQDIQLGFKTKENFINLTAKILISIVSPFIHIAVNTKLNMKLAIFSGTITAFPIIQ
jgi:hypothetical protein